MCTGVTYLCILRLRIVSNRIFFKNTKKETANQTVELISNKNKN
jgi:hypothetical protein